MSPAAQPGGDAPHATGPPRSEGEQLSVLKGDPHMRRPGATAASRPRPEPAASGVKGAPGADHTAFPIVGDIT